MEPQVQYAKTDDGVSIAYATVGEGPALIVPPSSFGSFVSFGFGFAEHWRQFVEQLASHRKVVLYDGRGSGLSERQGTDMSLEARVRDLEAVVKASRVRSVALLASTLAGPAAITYAARHSRTVTHLVLYGTFSRGADVIARKQLMALVELSRSNWPMAAQMFADMSAREGYPEEALTIAQNFREFASGERVAELLSVGYEDDVTKLLPRIKVPALVLHRRGDELIPFVLAQKLAAGLPNARLVPLEGAVHQYTLGDSRALLDEIDAFLSGRERTTGGPGRAGAATLVTILFTDLTSSTALTQRLGDTGAQELVRAHDAIVRQALRAHGGTEIKHTGDGIMASFPTASGALECAVAIQRGVEARGEANLAVHVGLNAGEPVAEADDLFGTAVQLARRVCDQASGGEILVSDVVRQLAAGKGFLFADRGEVALRGFEDPVRLYEVRWRD